MDYSFRSPSERISTSAKLPRVSMTLPRPLDSEGELALGHLGRVRKWCGISGSLEQAATAVQRRVSDRLGVAMSWPSAVAHGCEIDAHDYVARHSMLPFSECVDGVNHPERIHAYGWPESFHRSLLAAPMKQAVFCRRCVEAQLEQRTFAVWRRVDHLPYRFRCSVHDLPLLRARSGAAHAEDPAAILESGDWVPVAAEAAWLESEAVRRLDSMSEALLRAGVRWPRHRVWARLRQRARRQGIRLTENSRGAMLSDEILRTFPSTFLTDRFPSFRKKVRGRHLSAVDRVIYDKYQPISPHLSLALAVLYRSAKNALRDLSTSFDQSAEKSGPLLAWE